MNLITYVYTYIWVGTIYICIKLYIYVQLYIYIGPFLLVARERICTYVMYMLYIYIWGGTIYNYIYICKYLNRTFLPGMAHNSMD